MGIIVKPLVTEKMTAISDKMNNRFGFIVRPEFNKLEIKREIEATYNVTVLDVNTMRYQGKNKTRYTKSGLLKGRKNAFKKAIVTLKGQYVNLSPQHRGRDTKLLVLLRKLLHRYQKNLLCMVSVLQVVVTM